MTSKQGPRAARIVVGMATVLAVTLLCGRDATAARPSRCQARKLAASITEIRALLRCAQIDAGPECAASAATRRQLAFAREEARGGCTTSGDSAAIGTQVGVLVSALGSRLIETQHVASRCTSGQIAALRQAATRLSSIHLRNASTGDPARLVSDLAAARARFTTTYERALAKGDCRGSLQPDLACVLQSGGVAAVAALLFEPAAQCPCWTAASLDAAELFASGAFHRECD